MAIGHPQTWRCAIVNFIYKFGGIPLRLPEGPATHKNGEQIKT
jgi:hypothetical protein